MKLKSIFLISFICLLILPTYAQEPAESTSDTIIATDVKPYEITKIPEEFEKLNKEIGDLWKIINDSMAVVNIDSIMPIAQYYLDSVRVIFDSQQGKYTYRSLENFRAEWNNYAKRLESWKGVVSSRASLLDEEIISLDKHIMRWETTYQDCIEKQTSEELQKNISSVLDSLASIKKIISDRVYFNLSLLNSIATKAQNVENAQNTIDQLQRGIQADYFYRNSKPIWKKSDSKDPSTSLVSYVVEFFNSTTRIINIFINNNLSSFYFHLVFFIILLISLLYIRRQFVRLGLISEDKGIQIAKIILTRPLMVALFLGVLSSMLIYSNRPVILTEAIFIVLLIPIFVLLPKIIPEKLMYFIKIIIILFIIDEIQIFLEPSSFLRRFILLLETLLVIWFFYSIRKFKRNNPDLFKSRFWRILVNSTLFFFILLAISALGNIFGYIRLSNFLTNSIVSAILVTATYYLLLVILQSILKYGLRLYNKEYWHNEIRINIEHRIERIIRFIVAIIWGVSILKIFNVYRLLVDWLDGVMEIEWTFANTSISLGGVISFILILIITFLLSSWIKKLSKSDFILRLKIPRGVPAAISMLTRYIIVAFGVYIALAAAGVDLGQFGLIAGALGVGIGFGLQNVVYNFISGLIISFERPIHVGDTIEVGTLMGNVTEIGVRSSKLKTFDGSEVIVPNGNLISKEVINWTLSDQRRRLKIKIRTDYNAEPQKVLKIIREQAEKHSNTLKEPQAMALFDGYGDSSLDFTLYFWVYFNVGFTTKSEVALSIYETLKIEGIGVPIPAQRWYQERDGNPDDLLPGSGE